VWSAGCYSASPVRLRCERTEWYKRNGAVNDTATPTDEPAPRTLLPLSRRSRLAADIAADAGGLLPHPFTPYRACPAGLLSVAGLRRTQLTPRTPPLTVSRGDLLLAEPGSREVPLGCSSDGSSRRRILAWYYTTIG
jgi:hypothetical protein